MVCFLISYSSLTKKKRLSIYVLRQFTVRSYAAAPDTDELLAFFRRGHTLFSAPITNFTSADILNETRTQGGNCTIIFDYNETAQLWGQFDTGENPFDLNPGEGYVAYCGTGATILLS